MKKLIIYLSLFYFPLLFAKEPSAFDAGNLDVPNPYGLTTNEKYILQNKDDIKKLKKDSIFILSKIKELEERVDGLKSVVEGIDSNLQRLKLKYNEISENKNNSIEKLRSDLNKTVLLQKENFNEIKNVLKELTSLIDNINNTYVSKNELKELYSYIDKKISFLREEQKRDSLLSKSGAYLFKRAKELYRKKDYSKAKEYFELAIKKSYKPATSNFYLGEICYYQKRYDCAINHYKKSVSLYSKSSFMPTLMLHTAISLKKIGQKKEAKLFFENLIKKFPDSKASKIAKRELKKLK